MNYEDELDDFRCSRKVDGKGPLSVMLQLTRAFSKDVVPIDPDAYLTGKRGQVAGLSEGNLRRILADHGIKRQLAKEAGRTSRGSMSNMQAYCAFVNSLPQHLVAAKLELLMPAVEIHGAS